MYQKALILLVLISTIGTQGITAQEILKPTPLNKETSDDNHPNSRNFSHFYLGYGFMIGQPDGDGAEVRNFGSSSFHIGLRYKRKFSETLAAGLGVEYYNYWYDIKQNEKKILPNRKIHDKEKLKFNSFIGEGFFRINLSRKGNLMGKFVDLGGFAGYMYKSKHYTYDQHEIANEAGGSSKETYNNNLVFTEDLLYGVVAKIGLGHFVFFGKYRLSDSFNENGELFPDLPKLNVGLEIGLHD